MRGVLFAKRNKPTVREVIEYLNAHLEDLTIYQGDVGEGFPKTAENSSQDILLSYMSPWIIPAKTLNHTRMWNINFHPGPPEYPGTGCFNFAMHNAEKTYGVTAHLMNERVDTGKIIAVKRFRLLESDSVYTLSLKSYRHMLALFFEVMHFVLKDTLLPECDETWQRKPYTRKQLEELCRLRQDMKEEEVRRRIRATTYPGMPGAYVEIFGYRFEYNPSR